MLPNLISPSEETHTLNEKTIHQESSHVSWDRKGPSTDLKEPSAISLIEKDKVETIQTTPQKGVISPPTEEVDPEEELQRYQSLHDIVAEQLTKSKNVER